MIAVSYQTPWPQHRPYFYDKNDCGVIFRLNPGIFGINRNDCAIMEALMNIPRTIRMHENDNVAIVVNAGGLPEGTVFPDGLTLTTRVPEGHKVALVDIAQGERIVRYDVTIGYALAPIARGTWIEESLVGMPAARGLDDLPQPVRGRAPLAPL
jgi:hypothetical protein